MPGSFALRFAEWCNKTITVEPWLGSYAGDGTPQYGNGQPVKCFIEEKVKMVRDQQGVDRVSNTQIYALGGPFNPQDRFTMPAGFQGNPTPPVLAVLNLEDKHEFSHSEIYL